MVNEPVGHIPVLPREVLELLALRPGQTVVDATVGLGGHSQLIAHAIAPSGRLICLDVDPKNLAIAQERLREAPCPSHFFHANFSELDAVLHSLDVAVVDAILVDLGVSSAHLDEPGRGFSFRKEGPLDMRMDPRLTTTAADLINRLKEKELGDVLWRNAQEPGSRRIARFVCEARRDGRITSTLVLAAIVARALGVNPNSHRTKIHPATRTFMALRMEVNGELSSLDVLLSKAPALLRVGGRIGIIAFHSLEDKPIKLDFRKRKNEKTYSIVTDKPVVAEEQERLGNPRSRSAKFRVAERI